ncbi:MAG: hypothetical protein HRU38_10110 [Saccharospirillaceae bacterium]|nr:hypothetical protein [Pseudomonadales bacterium]NRB79006.1 hypothetical protein [Saccharospirillaceae bacterium]
MALEVIVEPLLMGVGRVLGWIFIEIVFEILIRGLGFIVCRPFKKVHIEDGICAIMGLITLIIIVVIAYLLFFS